MEHHHVMFGYVPLLEASGKKKQKKRFLSCNYVLLLYLFAIGFNENIPPFNKNRHSDQRLGHPEASLCKVGTRASHWNDDGQRLATTLRRPWETLKATKQKWPAVVLRTDDAKRNK